MLIPLSHSSGEGEFNLGGASTEAGAMSTQLRCLACTVTDVRD